MSIERNFNYEGVNPFEDLIEEQRQRVDYETNHQPNVLRNVEKEAAEEDPFSREIEVRTFISRSKGKGRKRREPLEVTFIHYGNEIIQYDAEAAANNLMESIAMDIYGDNLSGKDEAYEEFKNRIDLEIDRQRNDKIK